ncbi:hypothetical protein C8Q78DRAFT_744867 [Trametes maxima]|nr:hypothetical protein C8Q78DRAFT_744867 [Trametes maxima]
MDATFATTSVPVACADTANEYQPLSLDELFDYDAYVSEFGLGNTTDASGCQWDDAFESLVDWESGAYPLDSASSDIFDASLLIDSGTVSLPLASHDVPAFDDPTEPFQDSAWSIDYLLDSADSFTTLLSYPQEVSNDVPEETTTWESFYLHTQGYAAPSTPLEATGDEDVREGLSPVEYTPVSESKVSAEPQEASCKRKRQASNSDIWPSRPKKARYESECPAPSTSIQTPPLASSSSTASTGTCPPSPAPTQPLRPILVSSPAPNLCPIPGCNVWLGPKDSDWRGHFRKYHHADLCDVPGCSGVRCARARCPAPQEGCKTCGTGMSAESVGRHYLNVHIALVYRCPLCGVAAAQRESACARHMTVCPGKVKGEKPS